MCVAATTKEVRDHVMLGLVDGLLVFQSSHSSPFATTLPHTFLALQHTNPSPYLVRALRHLTPLISHLATYLAPPQ